MSIGIVMTSGETTWNHDATSGSSALGNPTSELTYEDTATPVLEIAGQMPLNDEYFLRGKVGFGANVVGEGTLRDDDFLTNQVLFSSAEAVIADTSIFYIDADIGKKVVKFEDNRGSLSLFAGMQYWRETHDGFGVFNLLTSSQTLSESTAVISNTVEWTSLRLGASGTYKQDDRTMWTFNLAAIPFSYMQNEDSHLLRTSDSDLGPIPNIVMDGIGFGFEGEIGVAYALTPNLAAMFDIRYWTLMSNGDITFGPDSTTPSTFPLNDLDTYRFGVNAGLMYVF